jgi:hypothetical protein
MSQRATVRHGGRGKCAACASPDLTAIDEDLARKVPYRLMVKRYGIAKTSLVRHKANHLSPALTVVHNEHVAAGAKTIVERIEGLISRTEKVLDLAQRSGRAGLFLHGVRELREQLVVLAKLTGALNERPQVTVNLMASQEYIDAQTVIIGFVQERLGGRDRQELARRLKLIDGGKA